MLGVLECLNAKRAQTLEASWLRRVVGLLVVIVESIGVALNGQVLVHACHSFSSTKQTDGTCLNAFPCDIVRQ